MIKSLLKYFVMSFLGLLLAGISLVVAGNLEGYYTEEQVRSYDPKLGRDKVTIRKTFYAGDRWRKDEGWYGVTIARFDLDRIYVLDVTAETYVEITPEFLQNFASEGLSAFGRPTGVEGEYDFPEDLFVRTDATKDIGLWECYQVTTNPKYRTERSPYVVFWYTTDIDFPVQIYGEQLKQIFGDSPEVNKLFSRLNEFPGYPVRTEANIPNGNVVTILTKIERVTNMDPELFEVPKKYTKVDFPD
ncbi:hypothetical protein CEE37_09145 [candidate division LCP-89 bacterium B3_LCP]|uniref:DUF4412 domain-containing protein n=1 Tax=candidate division LCP-89 bacterium B3_LCP TaxID=2012998 RepID=A0A532UZW4_UNCL8|nr:MAG: hypothetical protein CEE37_09145 [candidate division LCP-89 bacterium B3_LCP]